MTHKRPPLPVIIVLGLAILTAAFFGIRALVNKGDTTLTASGTIEAVEISVSPEIGGKVAEVYVDEGDEVQTGDPLFRLDDTLLQAQRAVAEANMDLAAAAEETARSALATANANFALTYYAALPSASARTLDWHTANPTGYTLPPGYFSLGEQMLAAQAEFDLALTAKSDAQVNLNALIGEVPGDFFAAEGRLRTARASFFVAQDVLARANLSTNTNLRDAAQTAYDAAQAELEAAQSEYDALAYTEESQNIIAARAELAVAQERYDAAQDRLLALQTGNDSPKVVAAKAALTQGNLAIFQAHEALILAEANLALIDVQIAKLTIIAPADGVVLTRTIQPGEVIAAGGKAISLGQLSNLTITVYIPEDRYGELSLGQSATVSVDSFPGETFTATIVHIADQAEFTPRNVQTIEGRASTVFAIRLQVDDPDGKLKPGMPADVTFQR
jgi:HlyD family secretion protein